MKKLGLTNTPREKKVLSETEIQAMLIRELRRAGFIVVRNRATDIPGWPDLTVYRSTLTFFIEVKKSEKHKLSTEQSAVIAGLKMEGFTTIIFHSSNMNHVNMLIENLLKVINQ